MSSAFMVDESTAQERYAHGTRARYALGKCRCFDCRLANSDYETNRHVHEKKVWRIHYVRMTGEHIVRHIETGEIVYRGDQAGAQLAQLRRMGGKTKKPIVRPTEFVSTKKSIAHLRRLSAAGVGRKVVAQRSGLARSVISRILSGDISKTRRSTEARILAVRSSDLAGGAYVDAAMTWTLLDRLIVVGYQRKWISAKLKGHASPSLQISRKRVRASTERSVQALYAELWRSNARLRAIDPVAPSIVVAKKKADVTPASLPLSKRDPAIAKRWDALWREEFAV